jgi:hypothetical protein
VARLDPSVHKVLQVSVLSVLKDSRVDRVSREIRVPRVMMVLRETWVIPDPLA